MKKATDEYNKIQKILLDTMSDSDCIVTKKVKAKTVLLSEGDISNNIFFIKKGILRLWNNNDGRDISLQFFCEGEAVASFESFYNGTASNFSIEAIEDAEVMILPQKYAKEVIRKKPELEKLLYKVIALRFIDYTNYFLIRIKDKPEDRYRELLEKEPWIVERVPDYYIASYLGITPVSLSRIKKRIGM